MASRGLKFIIVDDEEAPESKSKMKRRLRRERNWSKPLMNTTSLSLEAL